MTDDRDALLARAFGPGADIGSDPEALARLRMLLKTEPPPPPEPEPTPEPEPNHELEPEAEASVAPRRSRALAWLRARWVPIAWTASVVAAVGATLAVTAWWHDPARGAEAVLAQTSTEMTNSDVFSPLPGAIVETTFESYLGVVPTVVTQPEGARCLQLVVGRDGGWIGMGCGSGHLPVIVDVFLSFGQPVTDEFAERFGDDALVRFTLDGDRVVVTSATPDPPRDAAS